ncbi:MAG: M48 family metallopeptidase [Actinomycetota bacterium]
MLYEQIDRNRWMTIGLFALFAVVVFALSFAVDVLFLGTGPAGAAVIAAVIAVVVFGFAWFAADNVVLGSVGARPADASRPAERELVELVASVSLAAGLPTPKVYVIDDPAPNAFATGRSPDKGVVAFTTGLLDRMDRPQVEAVAAHEISHIANRDSMIGVVAAVLVGVVLIICRIALRMLFFTGGRRSGGRSQGNAQAIMLIVGIVALVLAPIFAYLLRFAVSRRRESLADANAVRLTRNPDAMIGALEVLAGDDTQVDFAHGLSSHLWIEEPEHSSGSWLDRLTATHPPIPERIEALRAIAGDARFR